MTPTQLASTSQPKQNPTDIVEREARLNRARNAIQRVISEAIEQHGLNFPQTVIMVSEELTRLARAKSRGHLWPSKR